jgi:hypothetical protein
MIIDCIKVVDLYLDSPRNRSLTLSLDILLCMYVFSFDKFGLVLAIARETKVPPTF